MKTVGVSMIRFFSQILEFNVPLQFVRMLVVSVCGLFVNAEAISYAAENAKPNVVVIFADDVGYGDLQCYGATKVQTPNLNRLAAQGRRFTDAHSASAVCTPSRYALMTGVYPHRIGLNKPVFHKSALVVDPSQQTVASVMKEAGYATACIGKWHLGFGRDAPDWNGELKPGPLELGFDYYFGVPVVNSHPPFVFVENHRVVGLVPEDPFAFDKPAKTRAFPEKMGIHQMGGAESAHALYDDEAVGSTLTQKAIDWIQEQKDDPFFLYLSTTNIHHPFTPAPRFQGTSQCGPYGDFIHELDWIVGEVMNALDNQGIAENTLVIFTSDNGGMFNLGGQDAWDAGHRLNGELLGFKFGAWEGGHRVPFIAKWQGKIEADSVSNQLVSNIDLIATFASLTGVALREGQAMDSVNVLPALLDSPSSQIRDHLVISPSSPAHIALRKGKWVYIGAKGSGGFTARKRGEHAFGGPAAITYAGYVNSDIEGGRIKSDAPEGQLYDLEKDVRQTTNVYRENPGIVREMKRILASYLSNSVSKEAQVKVGYDAFPPCGSLRFTFESGLLDEWKVIEGSSENVLSNASSLPRWTDRPFNHEGRFHLSTIAAGDGVSDQQQMVLQSPAFLVNGDRASFLVSGGFDRARLYVALIDSDSGEILMKAGGGESPQMRRITWDTNAIRGRSVVIRIVDQHVGSWGHLTFDDFSIEGTLN